MMTNKRKIKLTVEFDELGFPTLVNRSSARITRDDMHTIGLYMEGLSKQANYTKCINSKVHKPNKTISRLIRCLKYALSPASVDYR